MTNLNILFRCSAGPPLEACLHFKGDEASSEEAELGTQYHKDFAAIFSGKKKLHQIPKSRREKAEWAISVQKEYCERINPANCCENEVWLYDADQQLVSAGHIDLLGETEYEGFQLPSIIDWKPGDYINREAQILLYAVGVMDVRRQPRARIALAYYQNYQVDWRIVEYGEARARLELLVERVRGQRGPEPHRINQFCTFCAVRLSETGCPAWNEHLAIMAEQSGWPYILTQRMLEVKKDPKLLGQFITAMKRVTQLYEALELEKEAVRLLREDPAAVPGLKVIPATSYRLLVDSNHKQEPTDKPQLTTD